MRAAALQPMRPVDLAAHDVPAESVWCVCHGPGYRQLAYIADKTAALVKSQELHGRIVRLAALDPWPDAE